MSYKTVFNNRTIILPNKVIKELELHNGDSIRIEIAKVSDYYYAYIAKEASEVWREIFKR